VSAAPEMPRRHQIPSGARGDAGLFLQRKVALPSQFAQDGDGRTLRSVDGDLRISLVARDAIFDVRRDLLGGAATGGNLAHELDADRGIGRDGHLARDHRIRENRHRELVGSSDAIGRVGAALGWGRESFVPQPAAAAASNPRGAMPSLAMWHRAPAGLGGLGAGEGSASRSSSLLLSGSIRRQPKLPRMSQLAAQVLSRSDFSTRSEGPPKGARPRLRNPRKSGVFSLGVKNLTGTAVGPTDTRQGFIPQRIELRMNSQLRCA